MSQLLPKSQRVVELVEPELITDPELGPAPPRVRFVERRIAGATQYLRMRATGHGASAFGWLAPGELRLLEPSERGEARAWLGVTESA